jgi:hypothetical protein
MCKRSLNGCAGVLEPAASVLMFRSGYRDSTWKCTSAGKVAGLVLIEALWTVDLSTRKGVSSIVAKQIILPSPSRKRGNPNWGKPLLPMPSSPTEFEMQMRKLGLTAATCTHSNDLRTWCQQNRNRCYIPEWLLDAWGIEVEALNSGK